MICTFKTYKKQIKSEQNIYKKITNIFNLLILNFKLQNLYKNYNTFKPSNISSITYIGAIKNYAVVNNLYI